jgi:hypothetical protein
MIAAVIIGYFIVLALIFYFCGYRSTKVFRERTRVLYIVSSLAQDDILADRIWMWRYEGLDKVGYNEMVFKFWRPVESFYEDAPFLR